MLACLSPSGGEIPVNVRMLREDPNRQCEIQLGTKCVGSFGQKPGSPVVILSARSGEDDALVGPDPGAGLAAASYIGARRRYDSPRPFAL